MPRVTAGVGRMGSMRSRGVVIGLVVALLVAAGGGTVWWRHEQQSRAADKAARGVLDALAVGWAKRDLTQPAVPFADARVRDTFAATFAGMGSAKATATVSKFSRTGDKATGVLDIGWRVTADRTWAYSVPVSAAYDGKAWAVTTSGSGSPWVPGLAASDTVSLERVWGTRGNLLDGAGQPLMPMGNVYPVQLDPTRATPEAAAALEKIVGEKPGALVAKLAAATKAGSKAPITVITYREADFAARRAALDALKGVIYPKLTQPLAKSRTFGQPLLGSFGPVTAEMVKAGNGRYAATDRAGTSGLQGQYDATLGGTPGLQVTASTGKVLFEQAAVDGTDVKTSLQPTVQDAAEKALASTGSVPSALVAVDVRTGDLVAVANSPALGFDRAMTGQYPPGSTMKIATTYALLKSGKFTPQTTVSCPKNYVVDGRSFHNFEGEELGTPTLQLNFAHSCNTAFIQMAQKLGDSDLATAAKALGVGAGWGTTVGVQGSFDGSLPPANGATDKAAAAIGQARDLVSPAGMAVLVGSIARGSYVPPSLVQAAGATRTPVPLDAAVTAEVRTMMGLVVTTGTGSALRGVPGGVVRGKTGTAEYGTAVPPKNRVWFAGYQGNLAFAVMVEDGVSGGTVAAPVAAKFLTYLAG